MNANEFRNHLENDLIPFWNKLMDMENGGFYGSADHLGIPDKTADKGCILNSRILWFYSSAYSVLKHPGLLENARHAFDFMVEHFLDNEYGGVYWSVTFNGMPADTTKHTYCQSFAVYALAAYYIASQNRRALELALSLFHIIEERMRDEKGYLESFNRDFTPTDNEKLSENGVEAKRTMNTLLHIMEAYSELYRAAPSFGAGDYIKNILRLFKARIYNPAKMSCEVFFDFNYNPLIDLESYGHNIEASWLIERACEVINDKTCGEEMRPIIDGLAHGALERGIDTVYHALNNECENGTVDTSKIWWVQAEAVIGFYNAYRNAPERVEYLKLSEAIWEFIQNNVIDKNSGEWLETALSNKAQPLVHAWKCPYHNGRMCIEMIRRLED